MKNKILTFLLCSTILSSSTEAIANDSLEERINKLEQQIMELKAELKESKKEKATKKEVAIINIHESKPQKETIESKKENKQSETQAKSEQVESEEKKGNVEVIYKKGEGIKFVSEEENASLKLKGYAQFDNRTFLNDEDNLGENDSLVRRARVTLEANLDDLKFKLTPDFGGSSVKMIDAFAEYKISDNTKIIAGKFKEPIGLERMKSRNDISFVEANMVTSLVPTRDVGIEIAGKLNENATYEIGVFNGTSDSADESGDADDHKDLVMRIFAEPFKNFDDHIMQKLGFGIAGTIGEREGTTTDQQLGAYKSAGQTTVFRYLTSSIADGKHFRINPHLYYYKDSFGINAEYVVSSVEVKNGSNFANLKNEAYGVEFSYFLTGEKKSYKGWPSIIEKFDPKNGKWGAYEIAFRYGRLTIDEDAFPVFANLSTAVKEINNYGFAVNAYLNDYLKVTVDYEYSDFEGGSSGRQNRDEEHAILSRVGVKF